MIEIPQHPDFFRNRDRHGQAYPCVICGKDVKIPRFMVWVVNGGLYIGTQADHDHDPAASLGLQPIGKHCLKKYPEILPYVVHQK